MGERGKLTIQYTLNSLAMFAWAFFIAILYTENRVNYYVAPRMAFLVTLGSGLLILLGAFQAIRIGTLWSGLKHVQSHTCGCNTCAPVEKVQTHKSILLFFLFAIPLVAGYMMKESVLTSDIAVKKGISYSSARLVDIDLSKHPLEDETSKFPTNKFLKEYTTFAKYLETEEVITVEDSLYTETLTTLDIYKEQFVGKKVNLQGFVYQDPSLDSTKFALLRFSVLCCIADAFPHGIVIDSSDAYIPHNDTWVDLTGTLEITKIGEEIVLQIHAEDIATNENHPDPYVYLNEDFGK